MLFSLANLPKKSLRDDEGALAVVPRLLKGRAALRLLEQAIGHFEGSVGKRRDAYDVRALEGIMENYRLGRCVEACLLTCYSFEQPSLESLLPAEQIGALAERGLDGPSALRLALWEMVNERHGGFAPAGDRERILSELARLCGLPPEPGLIDALLTLDSESSATLVRDGEKPSAQEIMAQYNRGAVKTLLAHSKRVVFLLRQVPGATLNREI